ncbi:hypothetical protein [Streptomyces endophytica]|uniref:Uncharacterized protein n=1 Tax=Streptomyces endophytica TaxID=2991496 RepID=A0ABY6PJG3_9ACTN|nr:hypothetical protein [Streptomyces endophytica]UZJ33677.1 hypothetical protein OJ254_29660 [Streptomyces endophytica]
MVAAAPRVVVIGAGEGVRRARAARLAGHYTIPLLRAVDVLIKRQPLPTDGYVIDSPPQLLDRVAGTGGPLPVLAFADLVVLLPEPAGCTTEEISRVLRYYDARGALLTVGADLPDDEIILVIDAALRGRGDPEGPPRPPWRP